MGNQSAVSASAQQAGLEYQNTVGKFTDLLVHTLTYSYGKQFTDYVNNSNSQGIPINKLLLSVLNWSMCCNRLNIPNVLLPNDNNFRINIDVCDENGQQFFIRKFGKPKHINICSRPPETHHANKMCVNCEEYVTLYMKVLYPTQYCQTILDVINNNAPANINVNVNCTINECIIENILSNLEQNLNSYQTKINNSANNYANKINEINVPKQNQSQCKNKISECAKKINKLNGLLYAEAKQKVSSVGTKLKLADQEKLKLDYKNQIKRTRDTISDKESECENILNNLFVVQYQANVLEIFLKCLKKSYTFSKNLQDTTLNGIETIGESWKAYNYKHFESANIDTELLLARFSGAIQDESDFADEQIIRQTTTQIELIRNPNYISSNDIICASARIVNDNELNISNYVVAVAEIVG